MRMTTLALVALLPVVVTAQGELRYARSAVSTSIGREVAVAKRKGLPEEPIYRRVEAARIKGATDKELAAAARRARLTMELGVEAMAMGGHARPSDEEIERCAAALEQGYTRSQVETVAKSAPPERSLAVAFDVLTRLSQRGLPASRGVDQVTQKLKANESDESIMGMLTTGVARRP